MSMSHHWILPPQVRRILKSPLGELLLDHEIPVRLRERVGGGKVYSVGDLTTLKLFEVGVDPDVAVVDWKTKREPSPVSERLKGELDRRGYTYLYCRNPPGEITEEAYETVLKSLGMGGRVVVEVDGEEDLLALLYMRYGGEGSRVVYGQPDEGVVVVEVGSATVKNIEALLRQMEVDTNEN